MIAKRVLKKADELGSYPRLAAYILSEKTADRVGDVRITNCANTRLEAAILETHGIQAMAAHIETKTYHLVISLAPGEHPSKEALHDIEDTICRAAGLGETQRISVAHHDTDQLHIHVAASLVHPVTHRLVNIRGDYKKMRVACLDLEAKYDLLATKEERTATNSAQAAVDLEKVAEIEQLADFIRQSCPDLGKAASWDEMHGQLADAGLAMQKRGPGLVIVSKDAHTKASSVDRALSYTALTKRLGPFQADDQDRPAPTKVHGGRTPKSAQRSGVQKALYEIYTAEKAATASQRKRHAVLAGEERSTMVASAKSQAAIQRDALRRLPPGPEKDLLKAQATNATKAALAALRARGETRARQLAAHLSNRPPVEWTSWLQARAMTGDPQALETLRARKAPPLPAARPEKTPWQIHLEAIAAAEIEKRAGLENPAVTDWKSHLVNVTSRGTLVYHIDKTTLRDDGDRLHLQGPISDKAILIALAMARERHGHILNIQGTRGFRTRVAHLAAAAAPEIRFDDSLDITRESRTRILRDEHDRRERSRPVQPGDAHGVAALGQQDRPGHQLGTGLGGSRGRKTGAAARPATPTHRGTTAKFPGLAGSPGGPGVRPEIPDFRLLGRTTAQRNLDLAEYGRRAAKFPSNLVWDDGRPFRRLTPGDLSQDVVDAHDHPREPTPGAQPSPDRDRLRDVSDGGMGRDTDQPVLPVPNPDHHHVGIEAPGRDHSLQREGGRDSRRDGEHVAHPDLTPPPAPHTEQSTPPTAPRLTTAEKYIAERQSKRAEGMSIAEHVPYRSGGGPFRYLGMRNIDGQPLALLQSGGRVMVLPATGGAIAAFNRLKIGDPMSMTGGLPRKTGHQGRGR